MVAAPKMSYSGTGINDLIITDNPREQFAFPRAPRENWCGIADDGGWVSLRDSFDEIRKIILLHARARKRRDLIAQCEIARIRAEPAPKGQHPRR